ncbi:MAG: glycosyltransferase family 2 protein [Nitrospirota bacterium]
MTLPKISVTIITHNEEENIENCLKSIKWADEIVVVDSFSADKTLAICKKYKARIIKYKWLGYSKQKNLAIDNSRNEWVLSLDADERITKELLDEIKKEFERGDAADGYYIARKNFFLGKWIKHCGWHPDYNLRLFKKTKGRFIEREVHERAEVNGAAKYLKHPMEHYTYKTLSDFISRLDRYSTLSAIELHKKGKRAGWSHLTIRPFTTFFKMYFLKNGFLEGFYGILLSGLYAFYTFSKYAKLWEMQRGK